jgi:hypothetical protein
MAKSKLSIYSFTPGAANVGNIKIPQQIHLSDVLLITNTTRGEVIYSFTDPNKGASLFYTQAVPVSITGASGTGTVATLTFAAQASVPFYVGQSITIAGCAPTGYNATATVTACTTTSVSYSNATTGSLTVFGTVSSPEVSTLFPGFIEGFTTLLLEYDTSTHTANDRILIYVDDKKDGVKIAPIEILNDPVDKFRISQPEALIDTDFEYSQQPSKWEALGLVQNYPTFFPKGSGGTIVVTSITGSGTAPFTTTIVTATAHGLVVGDVILVRELSGTNAANAEGLFTITTVTNTTTFSYTGKGTTASVAANAYSVIVGGGRFDNSSIPKSNTWGSSAKLTLATTAATGTGSVATLTFASQTQPPFYPGQTITVAGVTPAGYNGTFAVTASTPTTVSYANATTGAQTVAGTIIATSSIITVTTSSAHGLLPSSPVEITGFSGATSATRVAASAGRGYNTSATVTGVTFTSATNTPGTKGQCTVTTDANGSISTIQLTNTGTGYTNPAQLTDCILDVGTGSPALTLSTVAISNRASATTTRTITTSVAHNIVANNWVTISGINANYDGTYQVVSAPTGTTFTYTAPTFTETSVASAGTVVNICRFTVDTESNLATKTINGSRNIISVETPITFKVIAGGYVLDSTTALASGVNATPASLFARSDGYVAHRAQDGGCLISTSNNLVGVQQIRQTRRYFRYQSGKGVQMSTGTKFTPSFSIKNISASGATATITTLEDHGLQPGARVFIEGVQVGSGTNTYNGTFTVSAVTSAKVFTYTMSATPSDLTPAGDQMNVTAISWNGSYVRVGMFDGQNGMFFEYDGTTLFAVRRQTIQELMGTIAVNAGSQTVTGTDTRFRRQLTPGDFVVIKGGTYLVNRVSSDTSMEISPTFRSSVNVTNGRYQKTIDIKIPQSQWNMDKMDGSGPTGYILDIKKMQMAYIDYSWYGAGYIRYGFRANNGQVSYCHKIINNNQNLQAYMRSGNLPARYEVFNFGYYSRLSAGAVATRGTALGTSDTTLHVVDATYWPSSGTIFIEDASNCELATYTSKTQVAGVGWALGGLTRRTTTILTAFPSNVVLNGSAVANTFTPSPGEGGVGTSSVSVTLINQTCAPTLSHWGTSVIIDGRFDADKEYEFTAGMRTRVSVSSGQSKPLISIRIAPSADNGLGRNFGVREIINRMQLSLTSVGVYSTGQFLIQGILNPNLVLSGQSFPSAWELPANSVGSTGSLAQAIFHNSAESVSGGEVLFTFYASNSGGSNFTVTSRQLDNVRELGTSILSGNGSSITPGYPNAPDILTIVAQNLVPVLTTTTATSSAGTSTLTFANQSAAPFYIGQTIVVAGVTPVGFNGTYTVTACTASSVSYAGNTVGPQTVAGTITASGDAFSRISWTEAQA